MVIQNNSQRLLVAYALRATLVDHNGRSGDRTRVFFNFEGVSNGTEIRPGHMRLITLSQAVEATAVPAVVGGGSQWETELVKALSSQASVLLSLDLAVFDDALVVGPDESNSLDYLKAWVAVRTRFVTELNSMLSVHAPVADISRYQTSSAAVRPAPGTGSASELRDDRLRRGIAGRLNALLMNHTLESEVRRLSEMPVMQFSR